jgi:hypothetical protein
MGRQSRHVDRRASDGRRGPSAPDAAWHAHPVHHRKPLFDWGSEPLDDLAAYPPFEEVLDTFRRLREQTHSFLNEVGEDGLDQLTKCQPPGFGAFETVGAAIQIIACHAIGHMGGLTVVRAASGKERLFVPSKELREF